MLNLFWTNLKHRWIEWRTARDLHLSDREWSGLTVLDRLARVVKS